MKISDNEFFPALKKSILSVFTNQEIAIQLLASIVAISVAFLFSFLIQKIINRKLQKNEYKYNEIIKTTLSFMLTPFMAILCLVGANWLYPLFMQEPHVHNIIANVNKVCLVWLIASALLMVSHRHFIAYFLNTVMLVMTLLSVSDLLAPTQKSLSEIAFETDKFHLSLLDLIKGSFTLVILFWGAGVLSKTTENWLRKTTLSFNARELLIKLTRVLLYFLAFVFTLTGMGVDLTALTVFGGALAVGLGFGLQKIFSNFISGIILLFERTIEAGDLIEIGAERGWVRQMGLRHTLIETFDGREVIIPNEDLITSKVTNWTYNNTRARIDINLTIDYNSDITKACDIMIQAARHLKSCLAEPKPTATLREFSPLGISITLLFWIPDVTKGLIPAKSEVMLEIVAEFRKANIQFAVSN